MFPDRRHRDAWRLFVVGYVVGILVGEHSVKHGSK